MKSIFLEGKTFNSVKEACVYYNLNYNTIEKRLSRNWTLEEAFGLEEKNNIYIGKPIIVEGVLYNSIKEACKYYNLEYRIVRVRLHNKWTIEEAFELVSRKNLNEIILEGKTFINIKEACEYYNLEYKTVRSRLYQSKWTIEEAFELVPRENLNEITLEGKTFKNKKEACRYYNLNYTTVSARLHLGWSIEEAFGLIPRKRNK